MLQAVLCTIQSQLQHPNEAFLWHGNNPICGSFLQPSLLSFAPTDDRTKGYSSSTSIFHRPCNMETISKLDSQLGKLLSQCHLQSQCPQTYEPKPLDLPFWKRLLKYKHHIFNHISWVARDGTQINVDHDHWLPEWGPLNQHLLHHSSGLAARLERNCTSSPLINTDPYGTLLESETSGALRLPI